MSLTTYFPESLLNCKRLVHVKSIEVVLPATVAIDTSITKRPAKNPTLQDTQFPPYGRRKKNKLSLNIILTFVFFIDLFILYFNPATFLIRGGVEWCYYL